MRRLSLFVSVSAPILALSACVAPSEPAPRAAPPIAVPAPAPAPTPAPRPLAADWRDWPLTSGNWSYRQEGQGSVAAFGAAGQEPNLILRCARGPGKVYLSWRSPPNGTPSRVSLRTTSMMRQFSAVRTDAAPAYPAAEIDPGDSVLDAIGFSRGRFVAEDGALRLVVPAWAEILRVVEDCRG